MMLEKIASWEQKLVDWAYEGLESLPSDKLAPPDEDPALIDYAYSHCEKITQVHSRTFFTASSLLPTTICRSVRALYAFCRVSDDLVDRPRRNPREALEMWRERALSPRPPKDDLVALAWADTRARHRIPLLYAEQLLDGIERDLETVRYATFSELAAYSYGVASTVGLMAMHIVGFSGPEAVPYAVRLGVALQMTNILRDVGEDWHAGRLYLPLEELAAFGLSEKDIATRQIDERWHAFLCFQMERVHFLYANSLPGIALLAPAGRFAIAAAAELYWAILDDILANGGDVFSRRAYVSRLEKLRRLPGIWWRTKTLAYKSANPSVCAKETRASGIPA
jgi:phytoene synthase